MGRTVAEGAVGRPAPHLAYPHGTPKTFGRREMTLASELGFVTAVTAEPGILKSGDVEMLALPRIATQDAYSRLTPTTKLNAVTQLPVADPANAPMPFMDPAFAIAICRYDLSGGSTGGDHTTGTEG